MKIYYFGHSYFYFLGKEFSIALDPFKNVGLKEIEVKADYFFCSHGHFDHNNHSLIKNAKKVENSKNFKIIKSFHDEKKGLLRGENNILLFNLDGYKIAFLGDYGENGNLEIEKSLIGVDILLVPIGGKYTIDYIESVNLINRIKPKTVIPMHFKVDSSTIDIATIDNFLKEVKDYKIFNSPYEYKNEDGRIIVLNLFKGDLL